MSQMNLEFTLGLISYFEYEVKFVILFEFEVPWK